MQTAQNLSMLQAQTNNKITLSHSKEELRAMVKQRQLTAKEISKQIENKRNQMRDMSKQINNIIEKKLKKQTKQQPHYGFHHLSGRFKDLKVQIEKIYKQNQQLKHEVKQAKDSQPQQLVKDIKNSDAKMKQIIKQIAHQERNKSILSEELAFKKEIIEKSKLSAYSVQLQSKESQYLKVLKQCKQFQKKLTIMNAQQLQLGGYYYQLEKYIQKQHIQQRIVPEVDQKELVVLINEINNIYIQRTSVQKESQLKIKNLQQQITKVQKQYKLQLKSMRQCQNDILRTTLQTKRFSTFEMSPRKQKNQPKIDQITSNPEKQAKSKKKLINKVYLVQKDEANTIIVGDWNPQGQIFSDRGQNWQILVTKVKKIVFLYSNEEIVGFRVTYHDKNGTQYEGRTMIVPNTLSYVQFQIPMNQIHSIEHSGKNEGIRLRFIDQNGNSKQIGKKTSQISERVSLQHYQLKFLQAQIGHRLMGLRFCLDDKPIEQKIVEEDQQEEKSVVTQRSFSNSTLGVRKAIFKGRSLKKLREQPIIDHRLALGKGKIV